MLAGHVRVAEEGDRDVTLEILFISLLVVSTVGAGALSWWRG